MDKNILKKFAIESRQELISKIENKIKTFYIDEDFSKEQNGDVIVLSNENHLLSLSKKEYEDREKLKVRVNELGLEQVIEEAAYTWFNRIIAIRYMEIHDYLPLTKDNRSLGIRVLSSKDNNLDPEIMKFMNLTNPDLDIDFKKEKYIELKDDNEKYKYVLLLVCKKLGRVIPQVFGGSTDYIDLLIPDNLLNETGFINKIIKDIPTDNYSQVEIIGWLYQFYINEKHEQVIDPLYGKSIKKEDIPAATQLFTPDWIVRYMVDNSLGKYCVEHSNVNANDLKLDYLTNNNIQKKEIINIEDITFFDPCCGSGHILVYAFEIFYKMYLLCGFSANDIVEKILKYNIYGLDIDDRAGQLAILSILLKAREYDKNVFNYQVLKNLNIMSISESNNINIAQYNNIFDYNTMNELRNLTENFKNAKEIGSLLNIEKKNYEILIDSIDKEDSIFSNMLDNEIIPLLRLKNILDKKYKIVVTNPPYMNKIGGKLKEYINSNYQAYSMDLFSCFIYKNINYTAKDGYCAFMTPNVWMSIKTYEDLRKYILNNKSIDSLIQLAHGSFNEIACVDVCSFVLSNDKKSDGIYIGLSSIKGDLEVQRKAVLEAINKKTDYLFKTKSDKFIKIPGCPITAYSFNDNMINIFEKSCLLQEVATPKQGIATSDNDRFVRFWFEVNKNNLYLNCMSHNESEKDDRKWYPYNKGGIFRKWYGNNDRVINWKNDGKDLKNFKGAVLRNPEYYFQECISWSLISSYTISFRYKENGFLFDVAGMSCFANGKVPLKYLLALNNSCIIGRIMLMLAPTINYQVGNIANIPVIYSKKYSEEIVTLCQENINLAKEDWDLYETSWNFKQNLILVDKKNTVEESYKYIKEKSQILFNQMSSNEKRLNEIFIDIYDVNEEFNPDINVRDISMTTYFDKKEDIPNSMKESYYTKTKEDFIKNIISYAVGCMFGRYSLDKDGLVYAGGTFDENNYKTFKVDNDNIIPITDEAYFSDDIVERFKTFIKTVYGDNTFNENMDFIAEALGKKGTETSEETIRRYFVNDFFNDHVKMYQKRPIYWLLDSGKKNGFKALVYMHRYNENLIPKVRLDYLHRVQTTYEKLLSDVNYKLTTDLSMTDKKEAKNRQADLNDKLTEIKEYDEKIAHIANQRISIDLDDGVKVNYEKFKDILAKIK